MKAPLTEENPQRVMCCRPTLKGNPCGNSAVYRIASSEPVCGVHRREGLMAQAARMRR